MGDLERAVDAYRQAVDHVAVARANLHEEIRKAIKEGVRQADLVRQTGYTRETLRRIARGDQA